MGENGTVWLPEGVSTLSPEIDSLFYFVYWVSVILFTGVVLAMAYFVYKYRRRRADEMPQPTHESKWLEISWVAIPAILVLVVFNWGFKSYVDLYTPPPGAYQIQVRGKQWLWEFEYPNGTTSVNEMHVPVDRPVQLIMSSQDVIHSFFIPAMRVKQDVLPNRYSSLWFQANKPGEYQIFCTEYCGTQHSGMLAKVVVESQNQFNTWLASAGANENMPLPEYGAQLYQQQACFTCHSTDGSTKVGPTFKGLFGKARQFADGSTATADENYIRQSILQPQAHVVQGFPPVMPASYASLNERQVSALIEFIKQQK